MVMGDFFVLIIFVCTQISTYICDIKKKEDL